MVRQDPYQRLYRLPPHPNGCNAFPDHLIDDGSHDVACACGQRRYRPQSFLRATTGVCRHRRMGEYVLGLLRRLYRGKNK